jgi:hypothetical protein
MQAILEELYAGPEEMDPYVGGLLEEKVAYSNLGPLFQTSIIHQVLVFLSSVPSLIPSAR